MKTGESGELRNVKADENAPWGKYSLLVKLNLAIGLSFVLTMALFLSLAYRAEKSFLLDHSVRLLRSTLEVIAAELPGGASPDSDEIRTLQDRLDSAGVHRHLLLVVDPSGLILGSADPGQAGKALSEIFRRSDGGRVSAGEALVSDGSLWWLRVGRPLPEGGTLCLFLDWGHIASNLGNFWVLHGVHVLVTLAVFFLLLWLVTERFVRRRLMRLLKAIRRMEMGRWDAEPVEPSRDEFGWLHERFREMGQKLKENVDKLVRAEKYASAAIVVVRVAREMEGPLALIRTDLQSLSRRAELADEDAVTVASLDRGLHDMERSLRKLTEIKHPSEWGV